MHSHHHFILGTILYTFATYVFQSIEYHAFSFDFSSFNNFFMHNFSILKTYTFLMYNDYYMKWNRKKLLLTNVNKAHNFFWYFSQKIVYFLILFSENAEQTNFYWSLILSHVHSQNLLFIVWSTPFDKANFFFSTHSCAQFQNVHIMILWHEKAIKLCMYSKIKNYEKAIIKLFINK